MSDIKYYSEEGLRKLRDELHHMIAFDRPAAAAAIAEARDKGDLSENAEYDAAKEAQGHLEARISKLQELIAKSKWERYIFLRNCTHFIKLKSTSNC